MVDEYFDQDVPSTARRVDGAGELGPNLGDGGENMGASESFEETWAELGASGETEKQKTTSSCGQGVSRDDTGGVEAAAGSCEDKEIKWEDNGGEDEQSGVRGDFEKSQKWWLV